MIRFMPFNKAAFIKYFLLVLALISLGFVVAIVAFNYALMPFDAAGSVISAALVANLLQLLEQE